MSGTSGMQRVDNIMEQERLYRAIVHNANQQDRLNKQIQNIQRKLDSNTEIKGLFSPHRQRLLRQKFRLEEQLNELKIKQTELIDALPAGVPIPVTYDQAPVQLPYVSAPHHTLPLSSSYEPEASDLTDAQIYAMLDDLQLPADFDNDDAESDAPLTDAQIYAMLDDLQLPDNFDDVSSLPMATKANGAVSDTSMLRTVVAVPQQPSSQKAEHPQAQQEGNEYDLHNDPTLEARWAQLVDGDGLGLNLNQYDDEEDYSDQAPTPQKSSQPNHEKLLRLAQTLYKAQTHRTRFNPFANSKNKTFTNAKVHSAQDLDHLTHGELEQLCVNYVAHAQKATKPGQRTGTGSLRIIAKVAGVSEETMRDRLAYNKPEQVLAFVMNQFNQQPSYTSSSQFRTFAKPKPHHNMYESNTGDDSTYHDDCLVNMSGRFGS